MTNTTRDISGPWTQFMDMHSGGGQKLDWGYIWIQAPEEEARRVFYAKFGRNADNVTCDCCGSDYSVSESASLAEATAYERNLRSLEGTFNPDTRQWVYASDGRTNAYLEPDEKVPKGAKVSKRYGREGNGIPLDEFIAGDKTAGVFSATVRFVWRDEITSADRTSKKGTRREKVWTEVEE